MTSMFSCLPILTVYLLPTFFHVLSWLHLYLTDTVPTLWVLHKISRYSLPFFIMSIGGGGGMYLFCENPRGLILYCPVSFHVLLSSLTYHSSILTSLLLHKTSRCSYHWFFFLPPFYATLFYATLEIFMPPLFMSPLNLKCLCLPFLCHLSGRYTHIFSPNFS